MGDFPIKQVDVQPLLFFFPQVVEILIVSIKTLTSPRLKTLKIIF